MRITNYIYNKLLSIFFSQRGARLCITGSSITTLRDIAITVKSIEIKAHIINVKNLYFALFSRKAIVKFSVSNATVQEDNRRILALYNATIKIKYKNTQNFQLTISLPDIGALFIQRDKEEIFFKATASTVNIINLLPQEFFCRESISQSIQSGIAILAYFNNEANVAIPRLNYIVNGFKPKSPSPNAGQKIKNWIIEALKSKSHLSSNYIQYDDFPQLIRSIVICTEDPAYYLHKGVCPYAMGLIVKSIISAQLPHGGGSTLTQQLMRNAFLSGEKYINRKIKEIAMSLIAENHFHLSKHDILEIYLNMAEMGKGIYGFGDASFHYFGKPIDRLNVIETLTLTYMLPRPIYFEDALVKKTEQLKRNLKKHILKFLPILFYKNVINEIPDIFPISGIDFTMPYGTLTFSVPHKLKSVDYIIIHCSATPVNLDCDVNTIRCMHLGQGFDDIGYHWVIKRDGTVETGREEELEGAHCMGYNHNSIGICYVGGLDGNGLAANTMTAAQEASMIALCVKLKKKFPSAEIVGHNQLCDKNCPCFDVARWVKQNKL